MGVKGSKRPPEFFSSSLTHLVKWNSRSQRQLRTYPSLTKQEKDYNNITCWPLPGSKSLEYKKFFPVCCLSAGLFSVTDRGRLVPLSVTFIFTTKLCLPPTLPSSGWRIWVPCMSQRRSIFLEGVLIYLLLFWAGGEFQFQRKKHLKITFLTLKRSVIFMENAVHLLFPTPPSLSECSLFPWYQLFPQHCGYCLSRAPGCPDRDHTPQLPATDCGPEHKNSCVVWRLM